MQWDEEVDRLAQYVRTHFGEEALTAASRRAMSALRPTTLPSRRITKGTTSSPRRVATSTIYARISRRSGANSSDSRHPIERRGGIEIVR